jgi:hypothetical protein
MLLQIKKNVYPVSKPAAVDYIMFNFGEFLSISNFVWRAFIKERSHHGEIWCCVHVYSMFFIKNFD